MPTASDCLFKILTHLDQPVCLPREAMTACAMGNFQCDLAYCRMNYCNSPEHKSRFGNLSWSYPDWRDFEAQSTCVNLCPVNLATFAPQFWVLWKGFKGSWIKIFVHMWSKQLEEKGPQGRIGKTSGRQKISIDLASMLFNTHICWIQNSRDLWVLYQMCWYNVFAWRQMMWMCSSPKLSYTSHRFAFCHPTFWLSNSATRTYS